MPSLHLRTRQRDRHSDEKTWDQTRDRDLSHRWRVGDSPPHRTRLIGEALLDPNRDGLPDRQLSNCRQRAATPRRTSRRKPLALFRHWAVSVAVDDARDTDGRTRTRWFGRQYLF